jgi:hypothetical protein
MNASEKRQFHHGGRRGQEEKSCSLSRLDEA